MLYEVITAYARAHPGDAELRVAAAKALLIPGGQHRGQRPGQRRFDDQASGVAGGSVDDDSQFTVVIHGGALAG